jgi:hypothetical protein
LAVLRYKEGVADVKNQRPPYQLTIQQEVLLQKIEIAVGRAEEEEEEEDWFEELDSDEDEPDQKQEDQVEGLVMAFMMVLLDHPLGDDEHGSALISAMAVLGINANCGWMSSLIYTPKQAVVVTVARMLVLY